MPLNGLRAKLSLSTRRHFSHRLERNLFPLIALITLPERSIWQGRMLTHQ